MTSMAIMFRCDSVSCYIIFFSGARYSISQNFTSYYWHGHPRAVVKDILLIKFSQFGDVTSEQKQQLPISRRGSSLP